jgi:hypothetical protein
MQLVLLVCVAFVLIGVIPRQFDGRQQVVIATLAVLLAGLQFFYSRFV